MNRLLTIDLQYPSPIGFVNFGQLLVCPTKKMAFSWDSAGCVGIRAVNDMTARAVIAVLIFLLVIWLTGFGVSILVPDSQLF